jgi:hypothetical protein
MKGKLKSRTVKLTDIPLIKKRDGERKVEIINLDLIPTKGGRTISIGRIEFEFHIFDLDTEVLKLALTDVKGFKNYMKENGGIRIYRDGIRVFDFGEPGNDWLNLDGRRVNEPVGKVSNRQILGVAMLDGETSEALLEKSNREGFVENDAYKFFQSAMLCTLTHVEAERRKDQQKVRQFYSRKGTTRPVMEEIADLREALDRHDMLDEMEPKLKAIENQFLAFQDTMLRAAVPGLTFGIVVHEAEKLIKELRHVVQDDDISRARLLVEHLDRLIDGLGDLFRRSGMAKEKASNLIKQAIFNCEYRFKSHNIKLEIGFENGDPDFSVDCSRRLVVSCLMNFVDNSIYWLQAAQVKNPKIFFGTSKNLEGGPCIIFADNGPGFQDDPDYLVQPFFSRKPDGDGARAISSRPSRPKA